MRQAKKPAIGFRNVSSQELTICLHGSWRKQTSGVELGFMSTTASEEIALGYSKGTDQGRQNHETVVFQTFGFDGLTMVFWHRHLAVVETMRPWFLTGAMLLPQCRISR